MNKVSTSPDEEKEEEQQFFQTLKTANGDLAVKKAVLPQANFL